MSPFAHPRLVFCLATLTLASFAACGDDDHRGGTPTGGTPTGSSPSGSGRLDIDARASDLAARRGSGVDQDYTFVTARFSFSADIASLGSFRSDNGFELRITSPTDPDCTPGGMQSTLMRLNVGPQRSGDLEIRVLSLVCARWAQRAATEGLTFEADNLRGTAGTVRAFKLRVTR